MNKVLISSRIDVVLLIAHLINAGLFNYSVLLDVIERRQEL
jgi:hypothetical protein